MSLRSPRVSIWAHSEHPPDANGDWDPTIGIKFLLFSFYIFSVYRRLSEKNTQMVGTGGVSRVIGAPFRL